MTETAIITSSPCRSQGEASPKGFRETLALCAPPVRSPDAGKQAPMSLRAKRSNPSRTAASLRFEGLDGILMQREFLPAQSRLDLFFPGQGPDAGRQLFHALDCFAPLAMTMSGLLRSACNSLRSGKRPHSTPRLLCKECPTYLRLHPDIHVFRAAYAHLASSLCRPGPTHISRIGRREPFISVWADDAATSIHGTSKEPLGLNMRSSAVVAMTMILHSFSSLNAGNFTSGAKPEAAARHASYHFIRKPSLSEPCSHACLEYRHTVFCNNSSANLWCSFSSYITDEVYANLADIILASPEVSNPIEKPPSPRPYARH